MVTDKLRTARDKAPLTARAFQVAAVQYYWTRSTVSVCDLPLPHLQIRKILSTNCSSTPHQGLVPVGSGGGSGILDCFGPSLHLLHRGQLWLSRHPWQIPP